MTPAFFAKQLIADSQAGTTEWKDNKYNKK
jgi:hypothetical protein